MNNFENLLQEMFEVDIAEQGIDNYASSWPSEDHEYIIEYMTYIFEGAGDIRRIHSEHQIYQVLKFLNSQQSDAMFSLTEDVVPWGKRRKCIRSMENLFTKLFCPRYSEETSFEFETSLSPLDTVCLCWFEWMPIHGNPNVPVRDRELIDPEFINLLSKVVNIESEICIASGLAGLDIWRLYYPNSALKILDSFLLSDISTSQRINDYAILVKDRIDI